MKLLVALLLLVAPAFADDYLGVHVPLDKLVMENGESFSKFFTREKNFDYGTSWVILPMRFSAAASDDELINGAVKVAERYAGVAAVLIDPGATDSVAESLRERTKLPLTAYLLRAGDNQSQIDLMAALGRIPADTLNQSAIVLDRDWRILQIVPVRDAAALKTALSKMKSGFTRIDQWLPIFIAFSIGFCLLCGAIFYQKITEKESPASAQ